MAKLTTPAEILAWLQVPEFEEIKVVEEFMGPHATFGDARAAMTGVAFVLRQKLDDGIA